MKKSILAGSLAAVIGATGVSTALMGEDVAHAEQTQSHVNYAHLADLAQNHQDQLNTAPIEAGAYNYDFNYNGNHYNFWSNGSNFSWSFNGSNEVNTQNTEQVTQVQAPEQAQNVQDYATENHTQQPQTQQEQPQTQQAAPQQAQKQVQTQQATPQQQAAPQQASSGSSANIPAHLQAIAQRESGGNIHAINPSSGAAGKYQFMQSTWDSVAPAGWAGKSPASAPESVQDAAAIALYNGGAGAGHWVTA